MCSPSLDNSATNEKEVIEKYLRAWEIANTLLILFFTKAKIMLVSATCSNIYTHTHIYMFVYIYMDVCNSHLNSYKYIFIFIFEHIYTQK